MLSVDAPQVSRLFINGEYVESHSPNSLPVHNPATGEQWATIPDADDVDVDRAVTAAQKAFEQWGSSPPVMRVDLLNALAAEIEKSAEELAAIEVRDNGKLLREMRAQLKAIPRWYRYYAGLADKIQGDTIPMDRPSLFNLTLREPLGVVACITAWNSPLLLASFKLAPALAAGNTIVLKPSEHASVSSLAFMECVKRAGFPPGTINVITGGAKTGAALVSHKGVAKASFTGSGFAGSAVAAAAAKHFASVTLELGGKSPNIVFSDANVEAAVNGLLAGIFAAGGQTCIAGSRALVDRSVYGEVMERLLKRAKTIVIGDPLDAATEMGPIANPPQLAKIESYVGVASADGAKVAYGGHRLTEGPYAKGLFFEPTVVADVRPQMRIAQEEVFGPMLAVIPFDSEEEALSIANGTEFGLAAGVWTNDLGRGLRMSRRLRAGTVWVNTYRAIAPMMPFGGYKSSGIGRENGIGAIMDFTQEKSVWFETEVTVSDPFTMKV